MECGCRFMNNSIITNCLRILNAFTKKWRKEDVDEAKSVDQYTHGNPHCEPKRERQRERELVVT